MQSQCDRFWQLEVARLSSLFMALLPIHAFQGTLENLRLRYDFVHLSGIIVIADGKWECQSFNINVNLSEVVPTDDVPLAIGYRCLKLCLLLICDGSDGACKWKLYLILFTKSLQALIIGFYFEVESTSLMPPSISPEYLIKIVRFKVLFDPLA